MNKLIGLIIIILVVVGGYFILKPKSGPGTSPTPTTTVVASTSPSASVTPSASVSMSTSPSRSASPTPQNFLKEFTVVGIPFSFAPSEIRVKKGDTVRIVFQNQSGFHDFVIDEFNIRTPQIQSGQTASVEFVANKTGTFEYYCSVGNHRAMGMHGNLIVE